MNEPTEKEQGEAALLANAIAQALLQQLAPALEKLSARIEVLSQQVTSVEAMVPIHGYATEAMKVMLQDPQEHDHATLAHNCANVACCMMVAVEANVAKLANPQGGDANSQE